MGDLRNNTEETVLSEYSEFIDDIMHHYDNSNEDEKREMFEDLLLFCCERADEDDLEREDEEGSGFWTGLVLGASSFRV